MIRTLFSGSNSPTFQMSTHLAKYPLPHPLPLLETCKTMQQFSQIHAQTISSGLIYNPLVATKLVSFLSSNPSLRNIPLASSIASQINEPRAYTWNNIIRGSLEENSPKEAILVYAAMRRQALNIDSYTVVFVIKACGLISGVSEGEVIHGQALKLGFEGELVVQTALLKMYGQLDNLMSAQEVFDETTQRDIVLWNALVAMYAQRRYPYKALAVACAMINENVRPDGVTAVSILSACSALRALTEGKSVHAYVIKSLKDFDVFVHNSLIDMYAKCGFLPSARQVFEKMLRRNIVSWTSMINGYKDNNCLNEAIDLFRKMESANVRPDEISLLGVVNACSKSGSFELAEGVYRYIKKKGFEENTSLANALMDMNAKCGNIERACRIFNGMAFKTIVSWTTMIQGLAIHGHGIAALVRFSQMQREGLKPDSVVFLSILYACSHAGLVDEGWRCFQSMTDEHGMKPGMDHYGCMVDLLCRAGLVNEAFEFVESMPMEPDVRIGRTLLRSCQDQGNMALARHAMDHLLELDPKYSENYILMSNLYATIGDWDNVKEIRNKMSLKEVIKSDPAHSLIEVNSVHT